MATPTTAAALKFQPPPPAGRIDIHSHLLPGVDDGCADLGESLECVRRLMAAGYVGTICTPHIMPELFPMNLPATIRTWTQRLRENLATAGLNYQLWPGGEVRLDADVPRWLDDNGHPTLAGSRCLLVDFWAEKWPAWVVPTFRGLIDRGLQPILAHPERLKWTKELDGQLRELADIGVWLQGNFNSLAGAEGPTAVRIGRQLLQEGRYQLLGLDMHRPDTLESRLEGVELVGVDFGAATLDQLIVTAPRELIFANPMR